MTAKITTLFEDQNKTTALYPRTKVSAITDENGVVIDNIFVNTSGDTMTGALILNADPTNLLGATTKQYVDNHN